MSCRLNCKPRSAASLSSVARAARNPVRGSRSSGYTAPDVVACSLATPLHRPSFFPKHILRFSPTHNRFINVQMYSILNNYGFVSHKNIDFYINSIF